MEPKTDDGAKPDAKLEKGPNAKAKDVKQEIAEMVASGDAKKIGKKAAARMREAGGALDAAKNTLASCVGMARDCLDLGPEFQAVALGDGELYFVKPKDPEPEPGEKD